MKKSPRPHQAFDRNKSLQELESNDWGEPTYDSHLVTECHRLRRVPLRQFTIENLRILIGQSIGLPYLVPLALERLRQRPLAKGDCYPGDLLVSVLRADSAFWRQHPGRCADLRNISEHALEKLRGSAHRKQEQLQPTLDSLSEAYEAFSRAQAPVAARPERH